MSQEITLDAFIAKLGKERYESLKEDPIDFKFLQWYLEQSNFKMDRQKLHELYAKLKKDNCIEGRGLM